MGGSAIHFSGDYGCRSINFHQFRDIFFTITGNLNVTTSIHCRKKHLPKVWGGAMTPLAPWLRHWARTQPCSTPFVAGNDYEVSPLSRTVVLINAIMKSANQFGKLSWAVLLVHYLVHAIGHLYRQRQMVWLRQRS